MDETAAPALFHKLKRLYHIKKEDKISIKADKRYDCWNIYGLWDALFGGKAFIPTNQRNTKDQTETPPRCKAGLKMVFGGTWLEEKTHRKRFKYRCPDQNKECPFRKSAYGCTTYQQIKQTPPAKVYSSEKSFKEHYRKRHGIEQYNAKLQYLGQETPNNFKRKSIENTIMFAVLGTALVAAQNAKKITAKDPP